MKKSLLKCTAILLVSVIAFSSCNNEEKELLINPKPNYFTQLQNFNDSILSTRPQTKSWGFMRIFSVAISDVIGAGGGIAAGKEIIGYCGISTGGTGAVVAAGVLGVAGGAVASYLAADQLRPSSSGAYKNLSFKSLAERIPAERIYTYTSPTLNCLNKNKTSAGYIHNETLNSLVKVSPTNLASIQSSNLELSNLQKINIDVTPQTLQKNYNFACQKLQEGNISIEQANQVCQNIQNTFLPYIKNNDYNGLINKLQVENIITKNVANIYKLFIEVYSQYPNDCNDVDFIIQKYKEIVDKSNLSQDDKDIIYMSLNVAINTTEYWSNNY